MRRGGEGESEEGSGVFISKKCLSLPCDGEGALGGKEREKKREGRKERERRREREKKRERMREVEIEKQVNNFANQTFVFFFFVFYFFIFFLFLVFII